MQLSVVILNYNVRHFLEVCVKSVQKALQNMDGEIIVVDNASTDGSKEMMQSCFPGITYLYQEENAGFPKGNNIGVASAKGEFVCILNPDTIVAEDTFEVLLQEYKQLDHPGILGCHLIDGSGQFLAESKRGIPTPWVAFTKVTGLYKLFPKSSLFNQYYAQHIEEYQTGKADILVGAFMLLKRDLYLKTGGFDEGCFMYSDDIDLSYMVLKQGFNNYYIPSTSVIHFKGESTLKDGTYMKRFKEAMQFFYTKHFRTSWFFDVIMNIGTALFALKKTKEQGSETNPPEHYILVSKNASVFQSLQNQLSVSIDWVTHLEDVYTLDQPDKQIEILIDNEIISFKEYIQFICQNKKSNKTFKIRTKNSCFFIGSNHKNDKGEVLSF
ncbi:MAG TPA: glycosyltransferase family 2 protein [Flavobacterium sp.]|nr:glycosyltransferase family 2 protein [Flavobacterium sp.]